MARPQLKYRFGLDLGNGAIKIATKDSAISVLSWIEHRCHPSMAVGSITLDGESFCFGESARRSARGIPTFKDTSLKINGVHQLFLGAIAHVTLPPKIVAEVVISSHAWATHKAIIKERLDRTFNCVISEVEREITCRTLMVVPEGYGAVYKRLKKMGKVATLDFGTGTVLFTPYFDKKPQESLSSNAGVAELYEMIAKEMPLINNGYKGDVFAIRRALELGSFDVDGVNIKDVYKSCLADWWNSYLADISKEAQAMRKAGAEIICIGGGAALPMFNLVLQKKGFELAENPVLASAQGLYQLAELKGAANDE